MRMHISRELEFENLHNARDLGGMIGQDGKQLVSGRLIRCGQLSELSENDREHLCQTVSVIVDFRTDGERSEKPDIIFPNVKYIHIPIVDSLTAGISREREADQAVLSGLLLKPEEAHRYMCDMYRNFVMSDHAVAQYSAFLKVLTDKHDKAVLWHCTAGKDRAGIASAIIEEILGVSREDIMEDYLATNRYLESDISFLINFVKKQAGTDSALADASLRYLFCAEREYIETFYDAVDEKYGDFGAYLEKGLQIGVDEIQALQNLYLC